MFDAELIRRMTDSLILKLFKLILPILIRYHSNYPQQSLLFQLYILLNNPYIFNYYFKMSKISTQHQSSANIKKQTSLAEKNSRSKTKPPPKDVANLGNQIIKID
jgi:hypothetical protein